MDQADAKDDTEKTPALMSSEEPATLTTPVEEPPAVHEEQEHPVEPEVPVPPTPPRKSVPRRASFVSRRSLLTGSAVAAASLVVGGSIGAMVERSATAPTRGNNISANASTPTSPSGNYGATPLVQHGTWHLVGTLDQIGEDALRFTTDTIVGYVIRSDDNDEGEKKGEIIALSASCTHMGCLIQWQAADRQFHCPCHGGVFTEYGKPSPYSSFKYLASLPRMTTEVRGNEVYVLVPKNL